IEQLSAIAAPNYGLITNVGKAHLEGFGGFEGVKKGKGELYSFLEQNGGTVFINRDNPHLMEMANKHNFKEAVYYGESGYISGELTENNPFLSIKWSDGEAVYLVKSHLTGIYNFENLLAGIAIGKKFGLSADEINQGIESYSPQNNRSQIIKTERNTIIGDFYNANPTSMLLAIENIAKLDADKKVLILGDMFELGDESLNEHRAVIEKALFFSFEKAIFLGKEFSKAKLLNDKAEFFDTPVDLISASKLSTFSDALILLKGSRGMKLEQLLEYL
ncbi:UDP-N-acetylmuramoyl-tripeptide--D-alanyl-D-alanine ligase, partial [Pseudoxanthomonas sp. SGD-10]